MRSSPVLLWPSLPAAQVLPMLLAVIFLHVRAFTSPWTSLPRPAPLMLLYRGFAPGLVSLQCGLPLEDWDDHPLCVSSWALDDPPCQGLFTCPVCAQWPEDTRQRFLATQNITAGQRGTSLLSLPPPLLSDQSLPSFSSLLSVDLGLLPAPLSTRTTRRPQGLQTCCPHYRTL